MFGVDKNVVALCSFEAVNAFEGERWMHAESKRILHDVYFVNIDRETTEIMKKVFKNRANSGQDSAHPPLYDDAGQIQSHQVDSHYPNAAWPGSAKLVFSPEPTGSSEENSSSVAQSTPTENNSSVSQSDQKQPSPPPRSRQLRKDDCVICLDKAQNPKQLGCGHTFCTDCIDQYFKLGQPKCPSCGQLFGMLKGNQPPGQFYRTKQNYSLSGYPGCNTIEITYVIPDGVQTVRDSAISSMYVCV